MGNSQSFTLTSGGGLLKVLLTPLTVCTPIIDRTRGPDKTSGVNAIWDTGASGSVITQKVVDELDIQPVGMSQVHTVSGQEESPVFLVDFALPNGVVLQGLRVTLGRLIGADALIGMDVIVMGDFSITNLNGKTKMSFRIPSSVEVDYVKESQDAARLSDGQSLSRQQRRQLEKQQFKRWKINGGKP